jgi:integrase
LPTELHLYCLRHTFGSLAIANGQDVRRVAAAMGHADPAMTLRMYAHELDGLSSTVIESIPLPGSSSHVSGHQRGVAHR